METPNGSSALLGRVFFTRTGIHFARKRSSLGAGQAHEAMDGVRTLRTTGPKPDARWPRRRRGVPEPGLMHFSAIESAVSKLKERLRVVVLLA